MLNKLGTLVRQASTCMGDAVQAVEDLHAQIRDDSPACVIAFVSPRYDVAAVSQELRRAWPNTLLVGCTTAGEISDAGYVEDHIVVIALPRSHFCVAATLISPLSDIKFRALASDVLEMRQHVSQQEPDWTSEFATLYVDGLSMKEDELVSALIPALGNTELFGGSAGDGLNFDGTLVMLGGEVYDDAAILMLVRTRCPVQVFRFDNFVPTNIRMVVTDADPAKRVVKEINAEPAAREYARLVGKDPDQLSTFFFAAHPVVVRVGGQHHVRSIQQVDETGHLRFFSEINEGMVLTVAKAQDISSHLENALTQLSAERKPASIIACDCLLRRLDAQQSQSTQAMSQILSKHGVVGFSTYGEQFNALHVNQTFTGVAIYPPEDGY